MVGLGAGELLRGAGLLLGEGGLLGHGLGLCALLANGLRLICRNDDLRVKAEGVAVELYPAVGVEPVQHLRLEPVSYTHLDVYKRQG